MADIESIGIRAVLEDLGKYLTGAKKMEDANKRLERSQVNLQNVSNASSIVQRKAQEKIVSATEATADAVRIGNDKIAESRKNLERTEKAASDRITESQKKVNKLTRDLSATAATDTAKRIKLTEQLSNAQIKHARLVVAQQDLVEKARRGVARTEETVANTLARSARTEIAAIQGVADVAVLSSGKIKQAQLGVEAVGGRVALGQGRAAAALNVFSVAGKAAQGVVRSLGSALIAVTGFSNRFAVALRFGALALAAFAAGFTLSQASQFETTLTKIDNLTEATTAETRELSKAILDLSKTVPTSPNDLGAAVYQVLSSGISDVNQALRITETAAKGSAIGLGSTADVARVVTSVINAYGKENINAAQATDILGRAIQLGSADATDFVSNIGRLLGIAPNLGIEFDQLAAAVASLTNVGLPANQAITALLGIMNQLISPSAAAEEALEKAGSSIVELQQNIDEKGLLGGLLDLLNLFEGNVEVLEDLFPEVRGLSGALLLLRDNGAEANRILERTRNAGGFIETAFEKANKTFAVQAQILRNRLNVAFITLGSKILPVVNQALSDFSKFIDDNRETINQALSVIDLFVKGLIRVVSEIGKLTQAVLGSKGIVIAAFVGIAAALVLIVGAVPVAAAALIGLVGIVINNWDKIRNATIDTWGSLPKVVTDAIEFIARDVLTRVKNIVDIFKNLFRGILIEVRLFNNILKGDWAGAWKEFKNLAANAAELLVLAILAPFGSLANKMIALAEAGVNGVLATIEAGSKKIADFKIFGEDVVPFSGLDLGRVSIPRINVPGLPEFNKSLDATGDAAKSATEEAENYTNNGLKEVEREYKRSGESAADAKAKAEALSDGIIDFAEATELGISAIAAGALEASKLQDDAAEKAFNYAKALSLVANAFQRSAAMAQKVVLSLSKTALQAAQAAGSALFSRPTKEIARLELALIRLQIANSAAINSLEKSLTAFDRETARRDEARQAEDLNRALREADTPEAQQSAREAINDFNEDRQRQRQRDAIQNEIDQRREAEASIQKQLDLYNLQNEALQKQIQAADATLLSQGALATAAAEVARVTAQQSQIIVALSQALGIHLVPEVDAMRDAAKIASGAFNVLTDENLRAQFIPAVDAASTSAGNAAVNIDELALASSNAATALEQIEVLIQEQFKNIRTPPESGGGGGGGGGSSFAHGGFVSGVTQATLHGPEVVLPLSDAARSRELLRSIPASLAAEISGTRHGTTVGSLLGDFNVQGYIGAELENQIVRTVRREVNRSRTSLRSVGLR